MPQGSLVVVAMLVLAACLPPAAAGQTPPAADEADALAPPYQVLLRSLAFPGWGQIENDEPWKAALFMTVQGGLLASGFVELRRSDRAFEDYERALERGDGTEADREFQRSVDRQDRASARFWWSGFALIIGMIDAYVDAHLRDFVSADVRMEPESSATGAPPSAATTGAVEARLALALEF